MSPSDRIIVPLDVPTVEGAIALLDKLPEVTFWKVGLQLFIAAGVEILDLLTQRQKRIFLDLKLHDIPNTVAGGVASATTHGVDLLTLHATAGRAALTAAAQAVGVHPRPKLLAITLLTSLNARDLAFDLKIPLELPEYVLQMALLARESGIDGAVCSPQEVAQLRELCGSDFLLVCPGVRPTWAEAGDQRRVMTPRAALDAGADYLVIGRPITAALDPVAAWHRLVEEVAQGS
ncbi:orotidine-5'-phosphate decarboxylase [Spirulina subsalsa]|uniref:orotidine-5'-phosphate decarboxylase n=1 Tax=Spirulina subsalsa TaxID=54311 RepID=UPI00030BAABC|nr:orotidine-5'-phosphate decarboxylase [Spirulina subsalsa]